MAGGFIGGLVCTPIARSKYGPAIIVGVFLTIGAILNAMAIPQPIWVSVAGVLVMIPMAWLGARLINLD